ncbi:MAG: Rrf2 family transcriptional regulator [Planctomycetota bacterium]|nr:MAG: Rrf2 family transcriptional regulator [Planctomycetota bacterium]
MISQTLEYALRAIVLIAQRDGQPCTARQISDMSEIPLPYLSKLMQGLVKAQIVQSQRGPHGGFVLAIPPEVLTIWDIVSVVDPLQRIEHCPLKIRSHGTSLCPLHRRLDNALAATEKLFRETTVDELLADSGGLTPLCESR